MLECMSLTLPTSFRTMRTLAKGNCAGVSMIISVTCLLVGLACNFGEQFEHTVVRNGTNVTEVYMVLDRLTAVKNPAEPIQCFEGYHNIVVALAMIGICCLYPTAMLTRPMFQGTVVEV